MGPRLGAALWRAERRGAPPAAALLLGLPALAALAPGAAGWLEFDRQQLASGEIWRLFTCHWAHWGVEHLVWDLAVFVLLGAVCWRASRARTAAGLASGTLLIPAGVWLLLPEMTRYRGLSGLDSALFVLLAALLLREPGTARRSSALAAAALLVGFAGKLSWELATASPLFVDGEAAGFVPVPLAHLLGGACGLAAGLWRRPARPVGSAG